MGTLQHKVTIPDNGYFIQIEIDGIRYRIITEYRQYERKARPADYRAKNAAELARIKVRAQARRDA